MFWARGVWVGMDIIADIKAKRTVLTQSSFIGVFGRTLRSFVKETSEIRFLAVGNFATDGCSEYQTALAMWMQDELHASQITAWDPAFKKRDLRILAELGIAVTQKDPKGPAVFFVPHAPYMLEPALLLRIEHNLYIGNDLTKTEANTAREEKLTKPFAESTRVEPVKVKPKEPWREAFKNTAFHMAIEE